MKDLFQDTPQPSQENPMRRAQIAMQVPGIKRFYREATVIPHEGRFAIALDGRIARTPQRHALVLATEDAARQVALEWQGQGGEIRPADMPLTRIVNAALDNVSRTMAAVADDIAGFAGSDLVCYRADEPEGLVLMQDRHWNPVLDFARDALSARFILSAGVMHVRQTDAALAAVRRAVGRIDDPVMLATLHVMTTLSGSVLVSLAAAGGVIDGEAAWTAAEVDEAWNVSLWGQDEEAAIRSARRRSEFHGALGLYLALAKPGETG
jgi:chaperone required for assembly of F1-ATPase